MTETTSAFPTRAIQAAVAALAALPGVATMLSGLGVPANLQVSFGGAHSISAVATLLLVSTVKDRLAQLSVRRAALIVAVLLVLGVTSFLAYQAMLYRSSVTIVYYPDTDDGRGPAAELEFRVPLVLTGELKEWYARSGGSWHEVAASMEVDRLREEVHESYLALHLALTDAAMMVAYMLIGMCMVSALAVAGYRVAEPQ